MAAVVHEAYFTTPSPHQDIPEVEAWSEYPLYGEAYPALFVTRYRRRCPRFDVLTSRDARQGLLG
jgi:hypothetical protein